MSGMVMMMVVMAVAMIVCMIVADMRHALTHGQSISELDRAFHEALLTAVRNPTFAYFRRLVQEAIQTAAPGLSLASARPA